MFAPGEGCADHFVCKWGVLRPPQPPRFYRPSMLALENKHRLVAMWIIYVCTRGRLCGSFCLQMGGRLHPPQPPRFLKAIDAFKKTSVKSLPPSMLALRNKHQLVAMWIIYVCTAGRLCGSFCVHMGGLRPPTPPLLKAIDA